MKWIICAVVFWLGLVSTFAGDDSPVGTWKTVDDETGRPKSIVRITEQDGELSGKVLQVLESPEGPHPLCRRCEGERKDQPVEGMTILWGAKKDGASWRDGQILDPAERQDLSRYSDSSGRRTKTGSARVHWRISDRSQPDLATGGVTRHLKVMSEFEVLT